MTHQLFLSDNSLNSLFTSNTEESVTVLRDEVLTPYSWSLRIKGWRRRRSSVLKFSERVDVRG